MMLAMPTTTNFDSIMFWAAMTLAFFGFLRLGELTCNCKFNPETHLKPDDVLFSSESQPNNAMFVRIKESKTDPFRSGQTITIGSSNTPLCPVVAMKNCLALRPTTVGPLFVNSLGKPLTKQELTRKTRQLLSQAGFQVSNFAGHSYRIGAATTAASARLPPWLIKTLGRWSSDCYERYIQTLPSTLLNVSATLAKI
jgi:hypothetical protein